MKNDWIAVACTTVPDTNECLSQILMNVSVAEEYSHLPSLLVRGPGLRRESADARK